MVFDRLSDAIRQLSFNKPPLSSSPGSALRGVQRAEQHRQHDHFSPYSQSLLSSSHVCLPLQSVVL
jgi:hypothetical protein